MRESLQVLLLTGLLAWVFTGCATYQELETRAVVDPPALPLNLSEDFEFLKTKTLLVTSDNRPETTEQMIPFEYDRVFYGAVSDLDREQRFGNYYTFFWKAERPASVVVRLEYRQAAYGDYIQAVEIPYPNANGKEISKFAIVGDDYKEGGRVTSWRCLIIENGAIVAMDSSRLWK